MPNVYQHSARHRNSSNRRKSKERAMKQHLYKRFVQRFGIELTKNMLEYMLGQIHKNKSKHVCNQSRTRAVHIVKIPINEVDTEIAVIYNKPRKLIHTAFPVNWLTDGSYEEYIQRKAYINGDY